MHLLRTFFQLQIDTDIYGSTMVDVVLSYSSHVHHNERTCSPQSGSFMIINLILHRKLLLPLHTRCATDGILIITSIYLICSSVLKRWSEHFNIVSDSDMFHYQTHVLWIGLQGSIAHKITLFWLSDSPLRMGNHPASLSPSSLLLSAV